MSLDQRASPLRPPSHTSSDKIKRTIMSDFFPVTPHLSASPLELKKPRSSGWELRALIDQRTMVTEGGRAIRRSSRVRRLAVMVAVQNLLVVTCLLVTLYLYMESPALPNNIPHIQFKVHTVFRPNTLLELNTSREYSLQNNKGNITIGCTGPYVWHMQVCYYNMDENKTVSGNLTLLAKHDLTVGSISMNATQDVVCRGLHSIVYLVAEDVARFHFSSQKGFWMNVSMGLSYLLGNRCEY